MQAQAMFLCACPGDFFKHLALVGLPSYALYKAASTPIKKCGFLLCTEIQVTY